MRLFIIIVLSAILLGCISGAQENNTTQSEPENKTIEENKTVKVIENKTVKEEEKTVEEKPAVEPPETCTDSDGKDIYEKGSIEEFGNTFTDSCVGEQVKEHYCEDGTGTSSLFDCPTDFICKEGRCVRGKPKCSDSDGGYDIYEEGSVTIDSLLKGEYLDKCVDSDTLREYYCEGDEMKVKDVDCTCRTAKCVD
jgi:hypothetical protein